MTARQLALRLTVLLDALGFLALAATWEVSLWALLLALGIALSALTHAPLEKSKDPTRLLFQFLLITFLAGLGAWWLPRLGLDALTVAAHTVPLLHAWLWHAPTTPTYRSWRTGLAFAELILAAAIAPEVHLGLLVFLYACLGSVAISSTFLETRLPAPGELPRGFLRRAALQTLGMMLAAALIFPLLPRIDPDAMSRWATSRVGYNETVSLHDWTRLSGKSGGPVALRLEGPENSPDLLRAIPQGLLRGRTLEFFDGRTWLPYTGPGVKAPPSEQPTGAVDTQAKIPFRVMRESLGSDILPVPYGAESVILGKDSDRLEPLRSGEFREGNFRSRRVEYRFETPPVRAHSLELPRDGELKLHRTLPDGELGEKIEALAKKVFVGARSEDEKIDALFRYFRSQNFSSGDPSPSLSNFLETTRTGNCEQFSAVSAFFLRAAGIPSRLVAGFRINRAPLGSVFLVRTSDAHAWVEARMRDGRWLPLDPTPQKWEATTWSDRFRDQMDLWSGVWYRAVLSYSPEPGFWKKRLTEAAKGAWDLVGSTLRAEPNTGRPDARKAPLDRHWVLVALAILLAVLLTIGTFLFRKRNRRSESEFLSAWEGPETWARERRAWEKALKTREKVRTARPIKNPISTREALLLEQWSTLYESNRFGRKARHETLKELRRIREELSRCPLA